MIGDPSGKSQERNLLDEETLRHNQDDMSYCEITQGVSENVQDSARGIFSVSYQVIVDNTAIKEKPKSSSKTIGIAYKGEKYKKVGESENWLKIRYGTGYGYIIKSALKKL